MGAGDGMGRKNVACGYEHESTERAGSPKKGIKGKNGIIQGCNVYVEGRRSIDDLTDCINGALSHPMYVNNYNYWKKIFPDMSNGDIPENLEDSWPAFLLTGSGFSSEHDSFAEVKRYVLVTITNETTMRIHHDVTLEIPPKSHLQDIATDNFPLELDKAGLTGGRGRTVSDRNKSRSRLMVASTEFRMAARLICKGAPCCITSPHMRKSRGRQETEHKPLGCRWDVRQVVRVADAF
jgi:hypothetical protein